MLISLKCGILSSKRVNLCFKFSLNFIITVRIQRAYCGRPKSGPQNQGEGVFIHSKLSEGQNKMWVFIHK